jgi:hypothetical protein
MNEINWKGFGRKAVGQSRNYLIIYMEWLMKTMEKASLVSRG